jgi:hypothetical protein
LASAFFNAARCKAGFWSSVEDASVAIIHNATDFDPNI